MEGLSMSCLIVSSILQEVTFFWVLNCFLLSNPCPELAVMKLLIMVDLHGFNAGGY
jgi:hypothetical protein